MFASITDEDITFLVQEKDSDNTKKATCVSVALGLKLDIFMCFSGHRNESSIRSYASTNK